MSLSFPPLLTHFGKEGGGGIVSSKIPKIGNSAIRSYPCFIDEQLHNLYIKNTVTRMKVTGSQKILKIFKEGFIKCDCIQTKSAVSLLLFRNFIALLK